MDRMGSDTAMSSLEFKQEILKIQEFDGKKISKVIERSSNTLQNENIRGVCFSNLHHQLILIFCNSG